MLNSLFKQSARPVQNLHMEVLRASWLFTEVKSGKVEKKTDYTQNKMHCKYAMQAFNVNKYDDRCDDRIFILLNADNSVRGASKLLKQSRKMKTDVVPEVLQVGVKVLILQQLTPDQIVAKAKLWHGQYLSFVRRGVAGGAHEIVPLLSTGYVLTEEKEEGVIGVRPGQRHRNTMQPPACTLRKKVQICALFMFKQYCAVITPHSGNTTLTASSHYLQNPERRNNQSTGLQTDELMYCTSISVQSIWSGAKQSEGNITRQRSSRNILQLNSITAFIPRGQSRLFFHFKKNKQKQK